MTDKTACSGILRDAICMWFIADFGAIAQLGERLLCKQEVVGSIPSGSTILSKNLEIALARVGRSRFVNEN